jgi:hypothetical protein
MEGDLLDNLTDEVLKNGLGMIKYGYRSKFLKKLESLKARKYESIPESTNNIISSVSQNQSFIIFDYSYYIL